MKTYPRDLHQKRASRPFGTALSASAVVIGLALSGCSTTQLTETAPPAEGTATPVTGDYRNVIETYSDGESEYTGFYNNFQYKATLLNSTVREAALKKKADYYQWSSDKLATELEEARSQMAAETRVFMSFYTPDRTNDNLADEKTIWRIYLEVGGRRYQGNPQRVRTLLAELQALFPYHSRWNTPYEIVFPVPTTAIENQQASVTVTGPLGTRAIQFKAVR